ncbi:MAG TPA: UDP-N-acetylglucosamine--N-acetylmuramyl-(pentapeptide) pyrophosphoryl-undecaprenol N-acetylglucosamine transferase [Candidatus Saccharimonadales bacterium]|jgi:UDP-N-acetylglucosamine--N-acetylmuramyl-(pentapeptide) pyrophosphoryl-undecaprenol N-acetylglucosamine transferase|nr:UDP-N-acetylglucosamine--N-acetylmuramyl-(pentapeptide) pyrophosphoryl-undecaprenol N-acetylglucosamine transferase [Candidatus Saccharimonadales bacterium]
MTIVVTGGGSGGHITPILAVANELKQLQPDCTIVYIGQRGDMLGDVPAQDKNIDAAYTIWAGKLRRYHGEGLRQLLDIKTVALNVRDVFRTLRGMWQVYWLLRRIKPDMIFIKGGFVGVPVGLMGALRHIPYVTHDSDALPGLANRIVARWATVHAVALPKEVYQYPPDKTMTVGVPISSDFQPVTASGKVRYRQELGLEQYEQIILMTGGGNGALRLNQALETCAPDLLEQYPNLAIVHIAGRGHEDDIAAAYDAHVQSKDRGRVIVKGFVHDMYRYSGAADIVITRAGATTLAEFAAQEKACIMVPNPILTGGHQLKNAQVLADREAVIIVRENDLVSDGLALLPPLVELLDHPEKRGRLSERLATLARLDSAHQLAMVLLDTVAASQKTNQ